MRMRGLRARVTALFAAGALLLSLGLAVATYQITKYNLVRERERTAVRAAYFDAAAVRTSASADDADLVAALRALDTGQGRQPLLRKDGEWYARTADDGLTQAVPDALIDLVDLGSPAVQRIEVAGRPSIVVGVPYPGTQTAFYEVQSLAEVESTLRTVAGGLGAAAALATGLAVMLSLWTAKRALSPLRDASAAARQVMDGDLTVRMQPHDDPDLMDLSDSFNGMVQEVSDRMERERRFAADVSHELRSPLQTLASASAVLQNRAADLDERSRSAAELITEEVTRFSELVQGLLELARAERPTQLASQDVTALLMAATQRRQLSPEVVAVDDPTLEWPMDAPRIAQVLDNLIANAENHGGGLHALHAWRSEDLLLVDVDDTGPGVPPDERTLVFDRFGRGRAANARGGTDGVGLGLALVSEHVIAHGGKVTVLDRPGGGGRFRVELPWRDL